MVVGVDEVSQGGEERVFQAKHSQIHGYLKGFDRLCEGLVCVLSFGSCSCFSLDFPDGEGDGIQVYYIAIHEMRVMDWGRRKEYLRSSRK